MVVTVMILMMILMMMSNGLGRVESEGTTGVYAIVDLKMKESKKK